MPLLRVLAFVAFAATAVVQADAQQTWRLDDGDWAAASQPAATPDRVTLDAVRRKLAESSEALSMGERDQSVTYAKQAVQLADAWVNANPSSPLMPETLLLRGDARLGANHYFASLFDYEHIARVYPQSAQFVPALEREVKVGEILTGGQKIRSFIFGWRLFTAREDGEEILIRVQERSPGSRVGERASLVLADSYFDRSEMKQAAIAYELFLKNYPESEQREWAMLRLIQASLARFRGPRFDTTGLIEAQQRLREYAAAFPAAADRIGANALDLRITESLARRDFVNAEWYRTRNERVSAVFLYRRLLREYPQTAAARDALARLQDWGETP